VQGVGPEYILGLIEAGHWSFSTNWMIAFTVLPSVVPELRELLVRHGLAGLPGSMQDLVGGWPCDLVIARHEACCRKTDVAV
jgi:hypothetical protein